MNDLNNSEAKVAQYESTTSKIFTVGSTLIGLTYKIGWIRLLYVFKLESHSSILIHKVKLTTGYRVHHILLLHEDILWDARSCTYLDENENHPHWFNADGLIIDLPYAL